VAELSTAARENLPDSAFACPEKRLYPHHYADGSLDLPHLRAALSRVGDPANDQCGREHLEKHAEEEEMGDRKALKAELVDDRHFRVLAIPFGGPIRGRDLDGEYFSPRTDIKAEWFTERPVLWHHGGDRLIGDTVIGKATDLTLEDDGWWVDVWVRHGDRRADLISRLAARAPLYGSSGTLDYLKKAAPSGEILVWPYIEQTLTTSPQNTYSVAKPAKAALDDFIEAEIAVSAAVKALLTDLDALGADLTPTSGRSEAVAMARLDDALAASDDLLTELRRR
jgi:hypothetical protein